MTDDDLLAAAHVLGILEPAQERAAEERALTDAAFAERVAKWAERLDALENPIPRPVDDALWSRIERAVDDIEGAPGTRTVRADTGVWERLGRGLQRRLLHVDRAAGTQSYYLRMAAGAVLPLHAHEATEQCVVLSGELRVGGVTFGPGDFHLGLAGEDHHAIEALSDSLVFIHGAL